MEIDQALSPFISNDFRFLRVMDHLSADLVTAGLPFDRDATFMQISDIFSAEDNSQNQDHRVNVDQAIFGDRDIDSANYNEDIRPLSSPPDKSVRKWTPSLSGQTPLAEKTI